MRRYIDIHCHPSTKPFLKYASGLNKNGKPSLWDNIKYQLFLWIDEWMAKDILDSQSALSQLNKSGTQYKLVVNPVIPMERELAKYTMFPFAVSFTLPFPKQISKSYFKSMQQLDYPYAQRTEEELDFSIDTENANILTDINNKLDNDKINLLLAIEGGHTLYGNPKFENTTEEVIDKLKYFKSKYRLFYLTITHLAPSPLANHCFSMKNVSSKKVHHFYPKNEAGISKTGYKVIEECLSSEKLTLIDIKHMSLFSRLEFYKFRKEKGYTTPILATHNGATGMSIAEWKKRSLANSNRWERTTTENTTVFSIPLKRPLGITLRNVQTIFNPSTINLFYEDIEEIVLSNGLIGLSFDERILGRGNKKEYREVIAESELMQLLAINHEIRDVKLQKFNKGVDYYTVKTKRPAIKPSDVAPGKTRLQNTFKQQTADVLYFLNNLLYMVGVANEVILKHNLNKNPWDFFALGSDFDGVIDAVDCCKTGEKMKDFEDLLTALIAEYMAKTGEYERYGINKKSAFGDIQFNLDLLAFGNAQRLIEKIL